MPEVTASVELSGVDGSYSPPGEPGPPGERIGVDIYIYLGKTANDLAQISAPLTNSREVRRGMGTAPLPPINGFHEELARSFEELARGLGGSAPDASECRLAFKVYSACLPAWPIQ